MWLLFLEHPQLFLTLPSNFLLWLIGCWTRVFLCVGTQGLSAKTLRTCQNYSISNDVSEHHIFKYHHNPPALIVWNITQLLKHRCSVPDGEPGKKTTSLTGNYMHGCKKRQCLQWVLMSQARDRDSLANSPPWAWLCLAAGWQRDVAVWDNVSELPWETIFQHVLLKEE